MCVCVCVCVWERERERERDSRCEDMSIDGSVNSCVCPNMDLSLGHVSLDERFSYSFFFLFFFDFEGNSRDYYYLFITPLMKKFSEYEIFVPSGNVRLCQFLNDWGWNWMFNSIFFSKRIIEGQHVYACLLEFACVSMCGHACVQMCVGDLI